MQEAELRAVDLIGSPPRTLATGVTQQFDFKTLEKISESATLIYVDSWTLDGRNLLVEMNQPGGLNLALISLDSPDEPPTPILATRYTEWDGSFSPDGRWMVYAANETVRKEVYVVPTNMGASFAHSVFLNWHERNFLTLCPMVATGVTCRKGKRKVSRPATVDEGRTNHLVEARMTAGGEA